jgi:phosphotransferase family enzyme
VNLKTPIARISSGLAEHAAVRAWCEMTGGAPPASVDLLRKLSLHNAAVYRLTFAGAHEPAVFAKHAPLSVLRVERTVYEDVLPHLPVTAPRYRGCHEAGDGLLWLFIEDVGNACLSPVDPDHRALASRWLGVLHTSGAALHRAAGLPDGGPGRYLAHLHAGRARIRARLGNRALGAHDRVILGRVLEMQDALEARWPALERACEGMPSTLVHGDFQPKNLRLHRGEQGLVLCPIDWETAGWGVPAADLMAFGSPREETRLDLHAYLAVVRERWPTFDAGTFRKLSVMGQVFRAMAAVDWDSEGLRFEDAKTLMRRIGAMRHYLAWVAQALEAGAEWLG